MSLTNTFSGRARSLQMSRVAFDVFQLEDRNAPGSVLLPSLFLDPLSSFGDGLEMLVGEYPSAVPLGSVANDSLVSTVPITTQPTAVRTDQRAIQSVDADAIDELRTIGYHGADVGLPFGVRATHDLDSTLNSFGAGAYYGEDEEFDVLVDGSGDVCDQGQGNLPVGVKGVKTSEFFDAYKNNLMKVGKVIEEFNVDMRQASGTPGGPAGRDAWANDDRMLWLRWDGLVFKGSFMSNVRFTIDPVAAQRPTANNEYVLQTVSLTDTQFMEDGSTVQQSRYVVEGFKADLQTRVTKVLDSHYFQHLMAGGLPKGNNNLVMQRVNATFTYGWGTSTYPVQQGPSGPNYFLFHNSDTMWDSTKVNFLGDTKTYSVTASVDSSGRARFIDTGAGVNHDQTIPKP